MSSDSGRLGFHPRRKFSATEDKKLRSLVYCFGEENWSAIARHLPGRSIRQCRDRYWGYLSDTLNKSPWTREEDERLMQRQQEMGPKWKTMRVFFPGRTEISIRNRFNKLMRHRRRIENTAKKEPEIEVATKTEVSSGEQVAQDSLNESSLFSSMDAASLLSQNLQSDEDAFDFFI
jgi:hypothetical protein